MAAATTAALVPLFGPAALGCATPPEDTPCPTLAVGDLVVTELRGMQDGGDSYGQWIELFNASEQAVMMGGVRVEFTPLSGQESLAILVRNQTLSVPPGEYVVIGRHDDDSRPDYVDFGYLIAADTKSLFASALLEVSACDVVIDAVVYEALPTIGTLSLDGGVTPSATANDNPDAFCVDDADAPPGPATQLGQPGTPGEANRPCSG